ncbi:transposase [Brevibacillus sp. GCM10020057]|uniref:transposase n=1 Tax=Brevibacillus sp. GCM10020057 TaxID=3317327 RepID=UPI00362E9C85
MQNSCSKYRIVHQFPRFTTKLATAIVAEIGDDSQISNRKQLVAFTGLDPSVCSSGDSLQAITELRNEAPKD